MSAGNQYRFITRWRLRASAQEIYDILSQPAEYPRWWPSVYLTVRQVREGDPSGDGREVELHTRGWLPYTLRWNAKTYASTAPSHIAIMASGDFVGRGVWSIVQDGAFVDVSFDWKLLAEKPLLRYLSFLLKPAFEANHRWAMEQGRKDLELELERSRANTVEQMNAIGAPLARSYTPGRSVLLGVMLAVATIAGLAVTPPSHESQRRVTNDTPRN